VAYDDALQELYQAPLTQFVAERKRLAGELKSGGDAAGAKRLLERKRPTVSAWVVNQLYWHARDAFDEMLATAEQLRKGHLKASGNHREAIAKLRKRAAALLEDSGHAATESTLRRVTTTLSALAATGGFDPDPPGTLAADRDPPGFEAVGIPSPREDEDEEKDKPAPKSKKHDGNAKHDGKDAKHDGKAAKHDGKDDLAKARAALKRKQDDDAEEQRRADMAEKKRIEEERKRKKIERHKLEAALRTAKGDVDNAERAVKQIEKQLEKANHDVVRAQHAVDDIAARLAELDDE
jgi:hypothetical protein